MAKLEVRKQSLPLYIADAFTKKAFSGNSAAVCLLSHNHELSSDVKQKIASEMKLSETAFVKLIEASGSFETSKQFELSWFTPKCEVSLCGHATLASAAVLFSVYNNNSEVLEFKTISGMLKAKKMLNDRIEIDLPAYQSVSVGGKYEAVIKATVGQLPVKEAVLSESKKLLVRLFDDVTREQLEQIKVNENDLLTASSDIVGIIVTLKGYRKDCVDQEGNSYDFISRYFAPWVGVLEDPVTGSAHSVLAPYWAKILNKDTLYACQCSARRGELNLELCGERVLISGNAVIVVEGQISF